MKLRTKKIIYSACLALMVITTVGCGQKKEAVITYDGEDITQASNEYQTLSISNADKFSYNDLAVDSVKYLMNEQAVKSNLGEPVAIYNSSEKQNTDNAVKEKVYSYNDLTLIFSEIDGEYKLTAAASISNQDVFARGLKVGDNVNRVYDLYYRDVNCLNNEYYSEDKTTALGKMLYGNFTIDALDTVKATNKVEYGVINYNGYSSLETADTYTIEFTYFEPPYKSGYAQIDDDFAQLSVDVDNNGTITGIRWYYYPQE